jgi:hypothetical protein
MSATTSHQAETFPEIREIARGARSDGHFTDVRSITANVWRETLLLRSVASRTSKMLGVGVALLLTVSSAGCGKSAPDPAVVRIGDVSISRSTVAHWERAITTGTVATVSSRNPRQSPREQALELLIMANWLSGESAREGLTISSDAVERLAKEPLTALSKTTGKPASTGAANPDTELIARATLTEQKLREAAFSRAPATTETELASYYARHHKALLREETRTADLIEQLPSRSSALALAKKLGTGRQFTAKALHETVNRETSGKQERPLGGGSETVHRETPGAQETSFNGGLVAAIFAATPHQLGGPVEYVGHWVIFVVRSVAFGPYAFPADATAIEDMLNKAHQQAALKAFFARYRREWKAKTICRAGFIVAGCSESQQQLPPEANPL